MISYRKDTSCISVTWPDFEPRSVGAGPESDRFCVYFIDSSPILVYIDIFTVTTPRQSYKLDLRRLAVVIMMVLYIVAALASNRHQSISNHHVDATVAEVWQGSYCAMFWYITTKSANKKTQQDGRRPIRLNASPTGQDDHYFADDILRCIIWNEKKKCFD